MIQPKHIFAGNLLMLKVVGFWPLDIQNGFLKTLHKIYGYTLFVCMCVFFSMQMVKLLLNLNNVSVITATLSTSLMLLTGLTKWYSFHKDGDKYKELITTVETLYAESENSKSAQKILSRSLLKHRIFFYFIWCGISSSVFVLIFSPIIAYNTSKYYFNIDENGTKIWIKDRPIAVSIWTPFHMDNHFWPFQAVQFFYFLVGGYYQGAWDTLFIPLIIYATGFLKVLNDKIIHVTDEISERENDQTIQEKAVYDKLIGCIRDHYRAIRFVKLLNNTTIAIIFSYYLICGLMLCVQGIEIIENGLGSHGDLQKMVVIIMQLNFISWNANEIIEEKNKLLLATYQCNWFNQNAHFKKTLLNFRVILTLPIQLGIGRFFVMSLVTFLAILKMAYSAFAVFRKMNESS